KAAKQRAERRPGSEKPERKQRAEKTTKPRPERKPKAERAEKPKPERKPRAEKAARPKPERKPKSGGGLLFGRKKNKKTVTLPAGTNPEIVKEPFASSAPAAEKKKRGPKKFNILFVTDDSKRVKTIRTSADAVLLCTIGAAIVILAVFVAIVWNSLKTEEYKAEIEGLKEEIVSLSEDKIILEAEIENLEQELGNMNSEISAKESQAQADTELQALQSIPSALPLNSQALPSEYDKEKHWITVDAGAGTHVVATGDGTVTYAGESVEAGGYLVTVDHGNGYETNYYCQSFPVVTQGAAVTRGTTLYVIADTDKLIYQIKYEGEFVDPYTVLNIAG
ncbi:MAG: peptidoglycan DD-metalloendopeptidase family protein, partial [Lachnospiraceae bacterium]|nr:peptidoglycan DD-metalloendopeptidase family protein [Lachnospiraceae bacterium]